MQLEKQQQVKGAVIVTTLYHLDGSQSEMELTIPAIKQGGSDAYWTACNYLGNYVSHLSAFYIAIRGYEFKIHFILANGERSGVAGSSEFFEIPLGKVWDSKNGWIDLDAACIYHTNCPPLAILN